MGQTDRGWIGGYGENFRGEGSQGKKGGTEDSGNCLLAFPHRFGETLVLAKALD